MHVHIYMYIYIDRHVYIYAYILKYVYIYTYKYICVYLIDIAFIIFVRNSLVSLLEALCAGILFFRSLNFGLVLTFCFPFFVCVQFCF